jgi:signal recognition particle subunit SRP54
MNDLRGQLDQMRRMGGLGALAGMMPGMKKAQQAMASGAVDEKILVRMDAMIGSMTPKERAKPELLNAKRKIRIAKGSGTTVQDVNRLLKMHQEMSTAMKKIRKMGGLKGLAGLLGKGGMGGAMSGILGGKAPPGMDGLGGLPGLPGGGGAGDLPKLPPGFENFLKK